MQSEQYSQRTINLYHYVTPPLCKPSPLKEFRFEANLALPPPPPPSEEYCILLKTRRSLKFAASVVIWILHV